MTSFIRLRPATVADLGPITTLLRETNLPLDGVAGCVDDFIVAEADGRVIGSVAIERYGSHALLRSAAVTENARGTGIGAGLVGRIIDSAAGKGIRDIYLLTTTAQDYFPRFGFERIERDALPIELNASEELKGACPGSAIAMHRRL